MSEKTWAEGIAKGAFKDRGSNRWKKKRRAGARVPRIGIRAKRMAKRRA